MTAPKIPLQAKTPVAPAQKVPVSNPTKCKSNEMLCGKVCVSKSMKTCPSTSTIIFSAVADLSSVNGLYETRVYTDGCRFDAGKYEPKSNCNTNDGNKWACINNRLNQPDGNDLQCTGKLCPSYACRVMGVTTTVTGAVTGAKNKAGKGISVAKLECRVWSASGYTPKRYKWYIAGQLDSSRQGNTYCDAGCSKLWGTCK